MKKLIIAIGIIAAILAFLISFRTKGQLHVGGRTLNLSSAISRIAFENHLQEILDK